MCPFFLFYFVFTWRRPQGQLNKVLLVLLACTRFVDYALLNCQPTSHQRQQKKKEPSMLNCACSSVGRTGYRDTKRAHEFFLPYLRCSLATTPSSRLTVSPLTAKAPASDLTTYSHITHVTVKSAQASLILSQKPSNWKKKKGTYTGY